MRRMNPVTKLLLWAAVAMPLVYFGVQLVAAPFYPGYHFATDTASMLGTSASQHPAIFNKGAIVCGIAGLAGAVGLFAGLRGAAAVWLRVLVAAGVVSNGVLSVKAGLYPMPDPRHASWQFLFFPILLTVPLLLLATWRVAAWIRVYLLLDLLGLLALFPYMLHWTPPVFQEGTMQRLLALVVFVPVGVAAFACLQSMGASLRAGRAESFARAK